MKLTNLEKRQAKMSQERVKNAIAKCETQDLSLVL